MADKPYSLWPDSDAPGQYEAHCSCGIGVNGTAQEVSTWGRRHDDAPWRSHVVAIANGGRRTDLPGSQDAP